MLFRSYFAVDNLLKNRYSYWFDKPWFHTEGRLAATLHHTFLLGFPDERVIQHHTSIKFFWRRCRGVAVLLQGEFHTSNLFTLFLSCLVYFILACLLSIIKNTKKISYLHLVYFQFCFLLVIMSGSAHHVSVPEVEIRSFKQQSGESLKDAWYRISDAHRRCAKKYSTMILLRKIGRAHV